MRSVDKKAKSIIVAPIDGQAEQTALGDMYDEDGSLKAHLSMFNDLRLANNPIVQESIPPAQANTFEFLSPAARMVPFESPMNYFGHIMKGFVVYLPNFGRIRFVFRFRFLVTSNFSTPLMF